MPWGRDENSLRIPVASAVLVLCIAGMAAGIGAIHARLYGHDIFFLLDNGWRALQGQRVHLDYSSALGPLTFLLVAGGLAVSGNSVASVSYANALFAAVAGLWSVWLVTGRWRNFGGMLGPCFVALLAAAPFALGDPPSLTSHGMVYNRYGYALLTLVLLECFQPAADGLATRGRRWMEPALTGCAVGLLLFLKVSYFLVAIPLVGAALLFRSRQFFRVGAQAAGFLLTAFAFFAYLRFDWRAMANDLLMAGAARSGNLGGGRTVAELLIAGTVRAIPLAVLTFWCRGVLGGRVCQESLWRGWYYPVLAVMVVIADSLLLLTNAQATSYPLTAGYAVVLLLSVSSMGGVSTRASQFLVVAAGLMVLPMLSMQIAGLGYGIAEARMNPEPPGVLRFDSPVLRPLVLYDISPDDPDHFSNGREYVASVNDGIQLLTRFTHQADQVMTLDMANPFAFALGRNPLRGGMAAPAFGYTLNEKHHPSDGWFFGDASVVMVPKHPASPPRFYDGLSKIYEAALRKRFYLEAETSWWWLYRRAL